jgi:4-amino-4-deoxy-L-arabinose transferase-like glycosyltransferase
MDKRREWILVCALLFFATILIFWDLDEFPGGLHYENYDFGFFAAVREHGILTASDLWDRLYHDFAPYAFYSVTCSLLDAVFATGYDTLGVLKITGILGVGMVATTYALGRVTGGVKLGLLAVIFLIGSPMFLHQTRAGALSYVLHGMLTPLPVIFFILAHQSRKKIHMIFSGYALSLCYLASYVSFPFLILSFGILLVLARWLHPDQLLGCRAYSDWGISFIIFTIIQGAIISVFYCRQGPFYLICDIEMHGASGLFAPFRQYFGLTQFSMPTLEFGSQAQQTNAYNLIHDFFWGASPAAKGDVHSVPTVAFPIDHLGAALPGTPSIYLPVAVLLFFGSFSILRSRRIGEASVLCLWLVAFAMVGLLLSYHGRRVLTVLPAITVTAGIGYLWIERLVGLQKSPRSALIALLLGGALLVGFRMHQLHGSFREYVSQLKFNSTRKLGEYLKRHVDPEQFTLVISDKGVLMPHVLYCETGFRPYRLVYMSEAYFPSQYGPIMHDQGGRPTLSFPNQRLYLPSDIPSMLRYNNNYFSSGHDITPSHSRAAFGYFHRTLELEQKAGRQLLFITSPAEDSRREASAHELNRMLWEELKTRNLVPEALMVFKGASSVEADFVLMDLFIPENVPEPDPSQN